MRTAIIIGTLLLALSLAAPVYFAHDAKVRPVSASAPIGPTVPAAATVPQVATAPGGQGP
jgi:hypothetical protein